jgi:hypothetical protein
MQIMEIMEGKVALNHPHYHSMVENARKFFFSKIQKYYIVV